MKIAIIIAWSLMAAALIFYLVIRFKVKKQKELLQKQLTQELESNLSGLSSLDDFLKDFNV